MERPLTEHIRSGEKPLDLEAYESVGGYHALRRALRELAPGDITQTVKNSNLRGRGGAGFPTGMKWSFVPMGDDAAHPKYLLINADEMEPGAFKDRFLLEGAPHQLIEGIILSAYAIQADVAYIFLRWAYKLAEKRLQQAIAEAYRAGYLGRNILGSGWGLELYLHTSAGRYICGEETALLNAMAGRRPTPRSKPPFPPVVGLWGKPTIVNNVETLSNVPHIVQKGADWFKALSHTGDGGTKLYGVSGKVKQPGLWELPMGTTIGEILEEHAGGMREGSKFRAVIPGGASTEFVLEDHLDARMDYKSMQEAGSRLGTGTMIVLDDQTCPVGMVHNLERFFARESCGWCTPCRDGLPWTAQLLQAIEEGRGQPGDLERLALHTRFLWIGHTYCALAPGAMEPLRSALQHFRDDFEQHIRQKQCPWR
ncbi:MAG: NADH-quinone oxidoreductase subunit NuoF [Anaerolineae bacterium]